LSITLRQLVAVDKPIELNVAARAGMIDPGAQPGDEAALAAAWRRCLLDADLRQEMARRARARIQSEFSLERMVESHIEVYRQLATAASVTVRRGGLTASIR